jgi:hypothetical protein
MRRATVTDPDRHDDKRPQYRRPFLHSLMNYTLEEYTSDIVYNIMDVCDDEKVRHQIIVSESGRATAPITPCSSCMPSGHREDTAERGSARRRSQARARVSLRSTKDSEAFFNRLLGKRRIYVPDCAGTNLREIHYELPAEGDDRCGGVLGLVPIMWPAGTEADVMKDIATPTIGGLFTSFPIQTSLLRSHLLPLEMAGGGPALRGRRHALRQHAWGECEKIGASWAECSSVTQT